MFKKLGFAAILSLATISAVIAGGAYQNFPTVGVPADTDCQSYGNNNVCNQYRPAGPTALTGSEIFPADTGLPGGQNPQTVNIPVGLMNTGEFRNALIGGDFNTNLWQRGTTFTAATPSTAAYTADRWFSYSSGNTVTTTRQTTGSNISAADGILASMRVNRPSGTDVTPICVGQVIPSKDAARFLGRNAIFSFYAMAPATFLSTAQSVDVTIAYVTAADSATPNTITDSFAKSTTTGYTQVVTKANSNAAGTTVANGSANIPLTTTFTRYYVSGTIPTTATSVGVKICFTPAAGTTGTANDYFQFANAQLEAHAATTSTALGITTPTGFARRPVAVENTLAQSFTYSLSENTGVFYVAPVTCTASGAALIGIEYGTQMRMTPTLTLTAGGFSIQTAAAVTAIGTTTLSAATPQHASLTSAAACTTTLPYQLKGTNTTGLILFSAEP